MALTEKLTAVADAIRARSGKTDKLTLSQMPREIAAIKGGVDLNFQVIWGDCPDTAEENTVWVDTASVESWVFSPAAPEDPAEGMVWIYTGTQSAVKFNALKKNGVMVYPLSVKQYVGGAWVDKTAKSYQNGAWVDWITYLYNNGDECADLTGGWEEKATDSNEKGITKGANKITVSVSRTSGNHQGSIAGTKNMVDLANVKTLRVTVADYSNSSGNANFCRIGVTNTGFNSENTIAAYKVVSGNGTVELDVSSLSGSYYIFFGIQTRWVSDYTTTTYSVTSVGLN